MQNFRNLIVWQKSHLLVLMIYELTRSFPMEERFNLTSQVRRAATSIPTNIAEGCGKSQLDFARFLQNAHGSALEVEYLALLSSELNYLREADYKLLDEKVNEIKSILLSLISKIRREHK